MSTDVFRRNAEWLNSKLSAHEMISDGIARDAAEYVLKQNGGALPDPDSTQEIFKSLVGEECAPELFPKFVLSMITQQSTRSNAPAAYLKSTAYVKSPASDRAFEAFSKEYSTLEARSGASFKEICEDLFYDRTDACILPLESSDEGLFMSFRQMLLRHELSIACVCRVPSEESYVSFALLTSKELSSGGECSEYFFSSLSPIEINCLLDTVACLGGDITRMNLFSTEGDTSTVHIALRFGRDERTAANHCIGAMFPAGVHLGDYNIICAE